MQPGGDADREFDGGNRPGRWLVGGEKVTTYKGTLDGPSAAKAMVALRADAEAGPLLQRLELWFHSPRHEELTDAEVTELLAPFAAAPAFGDGGGA